MIIRTLISTILLLAMTGAQAAMYKWTDEHGNVQFGQFPPPGAEAEQMKPPPPPASRPDSNRPTLQERVKALEEHKAEEQEQAAAAQQEREKAAQIEQNCKNARESIKNLELGGNRLYRMPDGTFKRFDEAEKQRRINKSKKYIAENCS